MRKLRRSVIRHKAETTKGKTIKIFRYLWKQSRTKKGHIILDNGRQIKQKSMIRRSFERALCR